MTADLKRVSRDPSLHESTVQSVGAARIHRPWRTKQNGKATAGVPTMRRARRRFRRGPEAGDEEETG
jgi:hypothetical protein